MTAAAVPDNVTPLGAARARKLLDDMVSHPFFVVIFTDNGVRGIAKGLDSEACELVNDIVQNVVDGSSA